MECPSCHSDTPDKSRFCISCGAALGARCPSCGTPNSPHAKFCSECAHKLAPSDEAGSKQSAASVATASAQAISSAERRQLTVMFCDLVGSTALSARLDPEEMREIIGAYHRCCAEQIKEAGGFVAKYMGDGVLAYFGYPEAHEDNAERAVRASLATVEAVGHLPTPERLQVRIGIATGLVVVGDLISSGEGQERGVVGETPNLAARLQTIAEADGVVIGPRTRGLLGDLFEVRDLGPVAVKGFVEPIHAYQALRQSAVESRFEALHGAAPTPLVGREEEIELLLRRWAQAQKGQGRVVLLSGESGIGKSRLATALQERIESTPHVRLRYFCSPFFQDSALHPTIARLERAAGFEREDTPETKLGKLEALLAPTMPQPQDLALLAELLSLPTAERYPQLNLSPQRKKEKTFEALLRQIELLASRQPVLMIYEDVHWIDPSSRELLDLTLERVRHLAVLLLITLRPEFQPPWIGQSHVTMHALSRLDRREGASLVQRVAGQKGLPDQTVDEIVARTDGIPLFVEEVTKAVLEAGMDGDDTQRTLSRIPAAALAVPATLHASLMSRLDRLGRAPKEIAQIGATIGREFSYELLAAVVDRSAADLQSALDRLTQAGLVFQRGTPPQAMFLFKHALVQDTAYGTLLLEQRRELHARVARALEERFPETTQTRPELLAHHYTVAGLIEKAVAFWSQAGQLANKRSALPEAIGHFERALELLASLPDTPARTETELDLLTADGAALIATKGYAAAEAARVFARARAVYERIGNLPRRCPLVFGQWAFHLTRGELITAQQIADELLSMGELHDDTAAQVIGHRTVGVGLLWRGKLQGARGHLERMLALMAEGQHQFLDSSYSYPPQLSALMTLSFTLFQLGYPDQAMLRCRDAIDEARRLSLPAGIAYVLWHACMFEQVCGRSSGVHPLALELIAIAEEQGFRLWRAVGMAFHGWTMAAQGQTSDGIAQLTEGLAAYRATGTALFLPYWFALLAQAHGTEGRISEGLRLLGEAVERALATQERWFEAELLRLKGKLLLSSGEGGSGAEACFRLAIDIARAQSATVWELRASTSLAHLWRDQGKRTEARDLLAPIYGWFTEGFDTPDLKDAKALLDELCMVGTHPP